MIPAMGGNAATELHVPVSDLDMFGEEFILDPLPFHAKLRESGPLSFLSMYGVYIATRYDDVKHILTDWNTFCSARGLGLSDLAVETHWRRRSLLVESDPPEHDRFRLMMNRFVSPAIFKRFKSAWEEKAQALVESLLEKKQVDAVSDIAVPFIIDVFPQLVGMPSKGRSNTLLYSEVLSNSIHPNGDRFVSAWAEGAAAIQWVEQASKRKNLSDDGLGMLVFGAVDEGLCTEEEGELLVRALVGAGVDTTVNALGNALHAFAKFPDQWRLLREDPTRATKAFEEALRWDTPLQGLFRTTSRPVGFSGVSLPEGAKIFACFASANRDPRRWQDPDKFDITRSTSGHLAFGFGIHQCLGQMIARLEAEVILGALAKRVTEIHLAGEPKRRLNNVVRGFATLPLELR